MYTLGLHADLSGDQKAVGRAQERGLRLAVDEFNSRADSPFVLAVKTVDDGGDPARAPKAAAKLVADRSVLAVIGPTTDATALASLAAYDAASLPLIAVSPGATVLGVMGSRSFLHARVTDTVLPFYLDAYVRGTAKSRTVGIVDDRAADAYGWEISSTLANILRKERQLYRAEGGQRPAHRLRANPGCPARRGRGLRGVRRLPRPGGAAGPGTGQS